MVKLESNTSKPDLSNMSLEDLIQADKPKKIKKKKKGGAPRAPANMDFTKFNDDQIRKELEKRGMPTKGSRKKLEARLKHCVKQAWEQYNKKLRKQNPDEQKPKKKKVKLSAEEKQKITEQNEQNRLAKLKRKAENKKRADEQMKAQRAAKLKRKAENKRKMEEARQAKRQRREETMAKRAKIEDEQKLVKEARQKCQAHVNFDTKALIEQIKKKFDARGDRITNVTYDFSKKGFLIKFKQPKFVEMATKGATVKKPTKVKLNVVCNVLPDAVESNSVFFLSPIAVNHPNKDAADEWLADQGAADEPDLVKLQLWLDSARDTFDNMGKIVNVFRERGFLTIHYATPQAAAKFISSNTGGEFNGVPFVFLNKGIPTKKDNMDCAKEFPRPKKAKKGK